MKTLDKFKRVAQTFFENGFDLYLVGGSSRDYILGRDFDEFDCTTNATPNDIKMFLPDADYTFEKYGNVNFKFEGEKFEITTLRKEEEYKDFRHPTKVIFVNKPEEDFTRRDFTINAIYINKDEQVYDFDNGLLDLHNHIIRMIGNPTLRIIEDPLRILRAIRFMLLLDFRLDRELQVAIEEESYLLEKLNPSKIKIEVDKILQIDKEKGKIILNYLGVSID